jgi:hypothetical protein
MTMIAGATSAHGASFPTIRAREDAAAGTYRRRRSNCPGELA